MVIMIEKHNFHWRRGFSYNFPKKRKLFNTLAGELNSRQVISITGLRRTGKTTLMKQLIDHLIKTRKTKRERILFYSFDEEQPRIEEIFREYEARLGKEILGRKHRTYVFLDEVQKLPNWQNQVKYYYDNYQNLKFFVSGSSSLFIKKHVQESLAGRIYEFVLTPLTFKEFLAFRDRDDMAKKKDLFQDSLKNEFLRYQKRQFVELVNESEERIAEYTRTMVEKIVYQDIPKIFPIEHEEVLIRILKIVASKPGLLSDYGSLSKELGISRVTLSNYFFYLEESFLIKKLYNFSKNMLTSEKKMKKFYLSTTSFFPFLNNGIDEARLVENLAVVFTNARFFWRTPQKYEIDAVLKENDEIIPIEVKYRERVTRKNLKNLLRFCERFKADRAVMITKDKSGEDEFVLRDKRKVKIRFVPAWRFFLTEAA